MSHDARITIERSEHVTDVPPEEVIASIDSSGWAVDPVAHGMTAMDYEHGEAELLMSAFQHRAGGRSEPVLPLPETDPVR